MYGSVLLYRSHRSPLRRGLILRVSPEDRVTDIIVQCNNADVTRCTDCNADNGDIGAMATLVSMVKGYNALLQQHFLLSKNMTMFAIFAGLTTRVHMCRCCLSYFSYYLYLASKTHVVYKLCTFRSCRNCRMYVC